MAKGNMPIINNPEPKFIYNDNMEKQFGTGPQSTGNYWYGDETFANQRAINEGVGFSN